MKAVSTAAEAQACDFAMLWTNLFEYYQKMGFNIAGTEISLSIPENFYAQDSTQYRILKSSKIDPQALLNLYNQHSLRTLRSLGDIRRYFEIPNTEIFTAWNILTNQLAAYAVVGKGADLQGHIHEWGGKVSALLSLIKSIRQQSQELTIILPPYCQNLHRQLIAEGGIEKPRNLGNDQNRQPNFVK